MTETRITLAEVEEDIKKYDKRSFKNKYEEKFEKILKEFSEEEKGKIGDLLIQSLESGADDVVKYIGVRIVESRKIIDWKSRQDLINKIFDIVIRKCIERGVEGYAYIYNDFLHKLFETLDILKLKGEHSERMFDVIRAAHQHIDKPNAAIHAASLPCTTKYPWVTHPKNIPEYVKLILKAVKHNPDLNEHETMAIIIKLAMCLMFQNHKGYAVHTEVLSDVTEMLKFCESEEWKGSGSLGKCNLAYNILTCILENYLICGHTKPELCKPMIDTIRKLTDCGDRTLERDSNQILTAMADKSEVMGDRGTEAMIEKFLQTQETALACKLQKIYEDSPQVVHPHLPEFTRILREGEDDSNNMLITQMMTSVVKTNPEKLPPGTTDAIAHQLSHPTNMFMALLYFDALAGIRPEEVVPHEAKLIQMYQTCSENSVPMLGSVLAKTANTKDRQKKYLEIFSQKVSSMAPGMMQVSVLSNMRQVGQQNVEALKQHRALIERLKLNPQLTDICQSTLDVMDGRSLQGVSSEVKAQKHDINQLDTRVTNNETDIKDVKQDVNVNKENIGKVKDEVQGQGKRLDDLKQVVDETVERVDELDRKTLSHAPAWSRDVARLLNVQSDHDWRLLASRLGYKGGDIQGWATQPDPCLSMLDEWFATHSTREATNAVRKNLVEMNRTDASLYIDQALKSVENVINDTPGEPVNPLPIFISYQWAHQKEAKLLRKHLALAGYPAYMDVGQINGGGGFFSKIDTGIRAAKVVICFVTQKYSESETCTKEVNLTTALGKPMVPLLIEKMDWPPPGSMGPIFGEYLFVRFFQREGAEQTRDDRFWPPDKFHELLIQLRYHVAPEIDAVPQDSPYRNWWRPTGTPAQLKTSASKGMTPVEVPEVTQKKISDTSPEVFISYQWDKQPEIKSLYRRLVSLGYSCWLDIEQMGGGDSLYDKIDKGLRGCNVIICCVTSKYAKSANCRREVSLADALKKPIIPLKLEQGMSWPPEGPMSMVLTSLTPIDFSKHDPQVFQQWNCPEFEILHKALSHNLGRTALPLTSNHNQQQQQQQQQQQVHNQNQKPQNAVNNPQAQQKLTQKPQGQSNLGQQKQGQAQLMSNQKKSSSGQKTGPKLVSYPRQKYY